jgi:drug/metabolite transporter (DMT)-like permease
VIGAAAFSAASPAARGHHGRRAMLLVAAFGFTWVMLEAVVGARLQGHYDLMQIVWSRYAVHLLALLLICGWRRPQRLWHTRRLPLQLGRSLLMLVMPLSFALAVGSGTPPGTVWSVFWVAPLMIIAIGHWLLRERVSWAVWVTAAIGSGAAALVMAPTAPASPWLLSLPIVMGLSFSLYVVLTRSLREEDVRANLFYTAFGVFAVLSPYMGMVWVTPTLHDFIVMIGIGVIGLLALLALDRAASFAPVSAVAPVLHLHVVCLAVIEALLHRTPMPRSALLGVGCIAIFTALLWWQKSWQHDSEGQPT